MKQEFAATKSSLRIFGRSWIWIVISLLHIANSRAAPSAAEIRAMNWDDLEKLGAILSAVENIEKDPPTQAALEDLMGRGSRLPREIIALNPRPQTFETIVRAIARHGPALQLEAFVHIFAADRSASKYPPELREIFVRVIGAEIENHTIHPNTHLRLLTLPPPRNKWNIIDALSPIRWKDKESLSRLPGPQKKLAELLAKDSEFSFDLAVHFLKHANSLTDTTFQQILDLLAANPSPLIRNEAIDRLIDSPAFYSEIERRLSMNSLEVQTTATSAVLKKILQSEGPEQSVIVDFLNVAVKRKPDSIPWAFQATLLKMTGFASRSDVRGSPGSGLVQTRGYRAARDRIQLDPIDPKIKDAAFMYVSLTEALALLCDPKSPYYDRPDLLKRYIEMDAYTFVNRWRPNMLAKDAMLIDIVGREPVFFRDGRPLPPRLQEFVGDTHLTRTRWEELKDQHSLLALLQKPNGKKALIDRLHDPAVIRQALLSQNSDVRYTALVTPAVREKYLPNQLELVEEFVRSLWIKGIAEGHSSQLPSGASPLFETVDGKPSIWRRHPEFLGPNGEEVTELTFVDSFLNPKHGRSFAHPSTPAANVHCLKSILESIHRK